MLPADPKAALAMKQIEALADGIMDAALTSVREQARPAAQQSENELLRQREKISRSLDMCEQLIRDVRGSSAAGQTGGDALPARKFRPD